METKRLDLYEAEKLYIGDQGVRCAYNNNQLIWGAEPEPPNPDYSEYYFTIRFSHSSLIQWHYYSHIVPQYPIPDGGYFKYQMYDATSWENYNWRTGRRAEWQEMTDYSSTDVPRNEGISQLYPYVLRFASTREFNYRGYYDSYIESTIFVDDEIYIYGNFLSMIYGQDFKRYMDIQVPDSYKDKFRRLFTVVNNNTNIRTDNLIMPYDSHGISWDINDFIYRP